MHEIADDIAMQSYNIVAKELNKFTPLSGDAVLSGFSTMISRVVARFTQVMHQEIASQDDTGYDISFLLQSVFDGATRMLNVKKIQVKEDGTHLEFKRINIK